MKPTPAVDLQAPTLEDLKQLLERCAAAPRACANVVLTSPESAGFADLKALPVELKSARRSAESELSRRGVEAAERERTLAPLHALEQRLEGNGADHPVLPPLPWTLVLVLGEEPRSWALASRDETCERPFVAVTRTPVALPVLRGLALERPFRVLALSVNRVALFEGDARGLQEVDAPGIPDSLTDALGEQIESPEDEQLHAGSRKAVGGQRPIRHGQGGAAAERRLDLERFHRVVREAVADHLRGREQRPLVLFATADHQGRLHDDGKLPGLVEGGVEGNPDGLAAGDVHRAVWPWLRERLRDEEQERGRRALEQARGSGELFVSEPSTLARRAVEGRVRRLWVAPGSELLATHLRESDGALEAGWPQENAIDQLAGLVLRRGGVVSVCDEAREHADGAAGLLHG